MRARNLKLSVLPALATASAVLLVLAASSGNAAADGRDAAAPATPAPAREGGAPISKTPPDPPPMTERQQWVFDLRWDRGDIYLIEVHKVDMAGPHQTPRVMGRFALELFEGPTVIERVRFDFPMLGPPPDPADAGPKGQTRFEPKLRTRIGVLFPATKRGTKLELWDRATNVRMPLPWPPTEGPASADAGVP